MKVIRLIMAIFFLSPWSGSLGIAAREIIYIDGSSTVYPVTESMAEEFQKEKKGSMRVTVGISGTGGGFKKFCRGETDISNASRSIKESEMKLCKENGIDYIELPVAFDALTVMVNPKNSWLKSIKVSELKKIWEPTAQAKVMKWSDVNPSWPKESLNLYGAGTDSGTYDYFAEAICGEKVGTRGDFTASEDDNVLVQGIATDKNALGFFGYSYYIENRDKLKALPIINDVHGSQKAVAPSEKTVLDGTYQPLSRPIFIYVKLGSLKKPYVNEFVQFYMMHPKLVKETGYVPLPEFAYQQNLLRIKNGETGTVFGGKTKTGIMVKDLYSKKLTK